ncbi:hypothetical protein OsJ_03326 [Oryza sativa Japonica Group]|uniref:Uncharacterized protein n=1 Tax=Oryza sativa subsp. japonica TaxID=39947 RepID=A2ZXG0_ORYSJ|nr:hypothetical protein OsJ_03326 [Oryza sativa Japonica Group]
MAASQRSVAVSAKCAAASWAEERRPFTDPIEIPAPSGPAKARREGHGLRGGYTPSKKMLRIEQQQLDKEEFQEADILWPDAAQDLDFPQMYYSLVDADEDDDEHRSVKQHGNRQKASSPIDIPARKVSSAGAKGARAPAGFSKFGQTLAGAGGGSFFVGSHVFVPPHVIVDHRRAKREKAMMMLVVPKGRARKMVMRE